MSKQEILERVRNIINQYPECFGDLDLLRHDLETDIIEDKTEYGRRKEDKIKEQFNRESA